MQSRYFWIVFLKEPISSPTEEAQAPQNLHTTPCPPPPPNCSLEGVIMEGITMREQLQDDGPGFGGSAWGAPARGFSLWEGSGGGGWAVKVSQRN